MTHFVTKATSTYHYYQLVSAEMSMQAYQKQLLELVQLVIQGAVM